MGALAFVRTCCRSAAYVSVRLHKHKYVYVRQRARRLKIFDVFERYFGVAPTARHNNLSETTVKHMIEGANAAKLFGIDPRESFARTGGDRLSKLKPDTISRTHLNGALGYITP